VTVKGRPYPVRFVVPLFIGAALNPINSSVLATALVAIAAAMHVSVGQTAILISSLYLTSAIAQPALGRLAEEFGPRRIFLVGITIVFVAGVVGGVANNLPTLVVARVLVGLGTSAGYPSAMLLIRRRAADYGLAAAPGGVLGGLAVTSAVTLAIGPATGGLLVGWLTWRAAFLVNVPVAVVAFFMALRWIAKDSGTNRHHSPRAIVTRIDLPGMGLFATAITATLVFLIALPSANWPALGLAVAGSGGLVAWELRASNPFIDVRLLASNLVLTRTYIRYLLTLLGIYVMLYGLTQWMEAARGLSPYEAGLVLLPMGVLSATTARVISRAPRIRPALLVSGAALVLGALGTMLLTSHSPLAGIIAVTALFGLVAGFGNVTNQTALYAEAPPEAIGTASGLLRTFGYIGSIAAATLTGVAFRTRVDDAGLHTLGLILVGVGLVVLTMTALDGSLDVWPELQSGVERRRPRTPEA
jgi:MFS family permease